MDYNTLKNSQMKSRLFKAMTELNNLFIAISDGNVSYGDSEDDYLYDCAAAGWLEQIIADHAFMFEGDEDDAESIEKIRNAKDFVLIGFEDNTIIVDDFYGAMARLTNAAMSLFDETCTPFE